MRRSTVSARGERSSRPAGGTRATTLAASSANGTTTKNATATRKSVHTSDLIHGSLAALSGASVVSGLRRLRGSKVQALKVMSSLSRQALKVRGLQSGEACKVWKRVVGGSRECRLYHVVLLGSPDFRDLPRGGSAAFGRPDTDVHPDAFAIWGRTRIGPRSSAALHQ